MKSSTNFILALLIALTSGCVRLDSEHAGRNRYLVEADTPETGSESNLHASGSPLLEVLQFKVSPQFARKEFVYRNGNQFETDYYNIFFIPPGDMITEETTEWLRKVQPRGFSISPLGRIDPDFTLAGDVVAIYGDFSSKQPAAVMEIRIYLSKETESEPKIVFSKNYRKLIQLKQASPQKLVAGWNQALTGILKEISADLDNSE